MFYTTRDEAIEREIITPLEASGVATAAEFDIDAIADVLIEYMDAVDAKGRVRLDLSGYRLRSDLDEDEFWDTVFKYEL